MQFIVSRGTQHRRVGIRRATGFTLLELMMAVTIAGVLASLGVVSYRKYIVRTETAIAISDIRMMTLSIHQFFLDNRRFPVDIAEAGYAGHKDPWGNDYVYLPFTGPSSTGAARKDRRLVPINSDFDLYSKGRDGQSRAPLAVPVSHDDIVRASNGAYIGLAAEF